MPPSWKAGRRNGERSCSLFINYTVDVVDFLSCDKDEKYLPVPFHTMAMAVFVGVGALARTISYIVVVVVACFRPSVRPSPPEERLHNFISAQIRALSVASSPSKQQTTDRRGASASLRKK